MITKKTSFAATVAALVLAGFAFTGCNQITDSGTDAFQSRQAGGVKQPDNLVNYVYGGNPAGAANTWWTYSFDTYNAGEVVIQNSATNTTTSASYTYNSSTGTGTITGYGTFAVSDDGSILTIGGADYDNLRPDGNAPVFTGTPPAYLVGTTFAASGPREPDWCTFTFTGFNASTLSGTVIASFTIDNTTNNWVYTYDEIRDYYTITANPGQTDPGLSSFIPAQPGRQPSSLTTTSVTPRTGPLADGSSLTSSRPPLGAV